jgi:hypothetical protein
VSTGDLFASFPVTDRLANLANLEQIPSSSLRWRHTEGRPQGLVPRERGSPAGGQPVDKLVPRVRDFVASGDALLSLRGGAANVDERLLRGQVAFGRERTIEQDSTFAFRILVDIAIKALSPAIDDPTAAVIAFDQLERLLRRVGGRDLRDERIVDADGPAQRRVPDAELGDFVDLTFSEIRQYGSSSIQVVRRLHAMIENVLPTFPEDRALALRRQRQLLDRPLRKLYLFPEDVALARTPDSQGLAGASDP